MNSILIKPQSVFQEKILLGLFQEMNLKYEIQENIDFEIEEQELFTKAQILSIQKGLEQADNGVLKHNSEVMEKAKKLCGL